MTHFQARPAIDLRELLPADIDHHTCTLGYEVKRSSQVLHSQVGIRERDIILPDLTMWTDQSDYFLAALYAISMHEIGHANDSVVIQQTTERKGMHESGLFLAELTAWQWAYDNAVIWSQGCQTMLEMGLQSYAAEYSSPSTLETAYRLIASGREQCGLPPCTLQQWMDCPDYQRITVHVLQTRREPYEV